MAKDLTKAALDNLKPGAKRREVPDGHVRGLYFVLQSSGATSWALRYRIAGRNRKLTLGPYPSIDLKAAREMARKALAKIATGGDPAAEKKSARAAARAPAEDMIEVVAERFIMRHIRANLKAGESAHESERLVRKEIVGPWRGRRMADITRRDVHRLLDAILDRGAPYAANRTLSALRKLYAWAVERDIVQASPCDRVRAPATEIVRDRVLDDGELKRLWAEAQALGPPFGSVLQLLVLTGQRLGEVSGMRWSEVDLAAKLWSMPRERTKNGKVHTVPLSPQAVAVIKATPRIAGGFVFTSSGKVPVGGFGRVKRVLDARLPTDIPKWRLHDIRRSTATGLARIGVDIVVVEKILNHASGAFRGIVGTYQRHGFDDERRIALDRWGRHIEALTTSTEQNVVELAAARR